MDRQEVFAIGSHSHPRKTPDDTEEGLRASKSLRVRIVTPRPPHVERARHTSLPFPALYNYFFSNKNYNVNSQAAGFLLFILISKREHSGFN